MSVVGIDLGTTNTVVACVRQGKVHVLADERGTRLLPSVVSFHPNGEVLVGGAAKSRRVIDPRNTVYSHKRLIGRSWGSPEIAQARQRFAFELREGPGQGPLVHARGQDYTLPEISAFVLKRTRQIAETALGSPVERAVITVPAHFNELQRASTKVAGRVSGLEVLRILNEPTAAALAYGLGRKGNERVAVYDFGGGTFDCTLLDLNGNVFEVLATAGDSFLGGDDIDNLIADRMAETYLKAYRQDPRTDPQMYERLRVTAEELKMILSTAETHTVVLKELGHGVGGSSINFTFTLSRRELEAMMTPLIEKSFKVTQDALALARLTPTAFDKVILVGGSTRAPLMKQRVEAFFGQPAMDKVNPDEVVAIGAAIQAAALTEGQRKRSIPAPPPVPGKPRTLPGVGDGPAENTYTSELNPNANKPAAAFASEPPSFGFTPQTSPPPATRSGPPPTGATGARPPPESMTGGRRATNVGVAPATRPQGPASARMAPPPGHDDDPSIASFPDLAVPTPFEWFPSSGSPSSGGDTQTGQIGSERSFGGNTITETQTAAVSSGATTNPRGPGFGAIDEPPSMYSTPSASVPSFPSMNLGQGVPSPLGDASAPAPTPSYQDSDGGAFGVVKDNSLVSTSGVSTSGVSTQQAFGHASDLSLISQNTATAAMEAITQARHRALQEGTFDDSDETEAQTRTQKPGGPPAGTMQLSAAASPAAKPAEDMDLPSLAGEKADLPAVVSRGAAKPAVRKSGQLGMSPAGGTAMAGKPPPQKAPQPFGRMERRDEGPASRTAAMASRPAPVPTASGRAVPTAPPPPNKPSTAPIAQAPPPVPTTSPMQARQGQERPGARTEAFGSQQAAPPPPPAPAFQSNAPLNAPFGSAPPQPFQHAAPFPLNEPFQSTPPQPHGGSTINLSDPFASVAPPGNGPFGSAPPPGFGSQPPAAFGSRPAADPRSMQSSPGASTLPLEGRPQAPSPFTAPMQQQQQPPPQRAYSPSAPPPPQASQYSPSQPPVFGFPSTPPDGGREPMGGTPLFEMGGGMSGQSMPPQHQQPGAVQSIGYQTPVLVDVTPRALVVETAGNYTDTIIPRNSKIPCERTRRFATGRDNQTTVRVRVGQGENQFFPQNTFLGEVELSGLRPAPRGEVVVAVTFEVDADGTLRIRARDVATGQESRATLQLIGVADESSVVMMINRFAQHPVSGGGPQGPQ